MTCREVIDVLAEYLEAELSDPALERLEQHLRACPECRAYLATYRRTVGLACAAAHVEMPAEMRRRLREFLVEELRGRPS